MGNQDNVIHINTEVDTKPLKEMTSEIEKAASAAERLAEALQQVAAFSINP